MYCRGIMYGQMRSPSYALGTNVVGPRQQNMPQFCSTNRNKLEQLDTQEIFIIYLTPMKYRRKYFIDDFYIKPAETEKNFALSD